MRRRRRTGRFVVGLLVLAALVIAVGATHALAVTDELLAGARGAVMQYAGADAIDPTRRLLVNGLAFTIDSGSTTDSVEAVLDAFQARCRERGPRFEQALDAEHRGSWRRLLGHLPWNGVLRLGSERGGMIACLDVGADPLSPQELLDRAGRFLADGDLAHVGLPRLVLVERRDERTAYLAAASDGSLPLDRAFPATGDAPGRDLPGVPRPPGATRVLSAWQQDAAPQITMYRSVDRGVAAVDASYRAALTAAGFRIHERSRGRAASGDALLAGLVAHRGDIWFVAAFVEDDADTLITTWPL